MKSLINIVTFIGTLVFWLVKKYFPYLLKKFGIGTVKFAIQKIITALLVIVTVTFYGMVIVFISETYTVFRDFIGILDNPSSAGLGTGGVEFSCFLNLLHSSGIAAGFNAAFSFGISVFIFFFFNGAYHIAIDTLKILSDELSKSLKLV
jgi:hypothetical protein